MDERRKWQRNTLSTTILFRPTTGGAFRSGKMRDISEGGVSFDTDTPPENGDTIDMFFKAHSDTADRRIRGRVVWVKTLPERTSVGVSYVN